MSQQQYAYDDWMQAAQEMEKQEELKKQEKKESQSSITDQQSQANKEQKKQLSQKQILKLKIQQYNLLERQDIQKQYTDKVSEENINLIKQPPQIVLKSEKDFKGYAKQIAERLSLEVNQNHKELDEQKVLQFMNQLTILLYKGLQYTNFHHIGQKMKAVKNQRKAFEKNSKKAQKQKQIQVQQNKKQKQLEIKNVPTSQGLFDGQDMNSKQQQQQRKNKKIQKVQKIEEKKPVAADQDDDDFM